MSSSLCPGELGIMDLGTVFTEACDASSNWYEMGLELKVPVSELDNIDGTKLDGRTSLRRMLNYWLKNSPSPSWKSLADAMGGRAVSRHDLKTKILSNHEGM